MRREARIVIAVPCSQIHACVLGTGGDPKSSDQAGAARFMVRTPADLNLFPGSISGTPAEGIGYDLACTIAEVSRDLHV